MQQDKKEFVKNNGKPARPKTPVPPPPPPPPRHQRNDEMTQMFNAFICMALSSGRCSAKGI